jgi:hypothetical protein
MKKTTVYLFEKKATMIAMFIIALLLIDRSVVNGQTIKENKKSETNTNVVKEVPSLLNNEIGRIALVFKITGMQSDEDARIIDDMFKNKQYIFSISTDFKTGLCKVETDKVENSKKVIDIISVAGKKTGHNFTAEQLEGVVEKK